MHFWGLDVFLSGTHLPSCVKALTPGEIEHPIAQRPLCQTKYVSLFAATIRAHSSIFSPLVLSCSEYSYRSLSVLSVGWSGVVGVAAGGGAEG